MTRDRGWRLGLLATGGLVWLGGAVLGAAELQDRTVAAWDAYVAQARAAFLASVPGDAAWQPDRPAELRAGAILAGPGGEDGIVSVPGGLVHHWVGAAFVPGVTLDDALTLTEDFSRFPEIYESVIEGELLAREGNLFRVRLRLEDGAGPITGVLDVWSDVRHVRAGAAQSYSVSEATEIREVADAGRPGERLLPAGEDRGFLWRALTFTRYVERDGGVYIALETMGLSRGFPRGLGWLIEPIARRLGRKSTEGTLRELRAALTGGAP